MLLLDFSGKKAEDQLVMPIVELNQKANLTANRVHF